MKKISNLETIVRHLQAQRMLKDITPWLQQATSMAEIGRKIGRSRAAVQQFLNRHIELKRKHIQYKELMLKSKLAEKQDAYEKAFDLMKGKFIEYQKKGKPQFYAFITMMRTEGDTYDYRTCESVFREYLQGRSMNSIAVMHGFSCSSVSSILYAVGLDTDPAKRKNYFKAKVK